MKRIGILGSENSHAEIFMDIFRKTPEYADMKVVACGGCDKEKDRKLYKEFNLEFIAERPEDLLGKVDAVMITARDGALHYYLAKPFLEEGLPMFIDKPFTCNEKEAVTLASEAKRRGIKLTGGSSLKTCYDVLMLKHQVEKDKSIVCGGTVAAPLNMINPYNGWFFYSSHLAEMSLTIFGYDPIEVVAFRTNNNVTAICHYEKYDVANLFMEGCDIYSGQVVTNDTKMDRGYYRRIDESLIFEHEAFEFVNMVRTGKMPYTYEQLVTPVFYLNAIKRSYEAGGKVEKIKKFEL